MNLQRVRHKATTRAAPYEHRIRYLMGLLLSRVGPVGYKGCAVCGLEADSNTAHFALPVHYIAVCLVLNNLDEDFADLPLRSAWLCEKHSLQFEALFVEVADPRWGVKALQHRADLLHGVMVGNLLVFGGDKGVRVVREFQASIEALKASR